MNKYKGKLQKWIRSKRFWKRFALTFFALPIVLFFILVLIVYAKQDEIVQDLISDLNEDFTGATELSGSHVSLFENFPYISIDLEHLKVFESKTKKAAPILNIDDTYVGFDLWTVLSGKMDIKKIKLENGTIRIVQHEDGEFNIVRALSPLHPIEDPAEEFHLNLKRIELENVDISKLNEANGLMFETFINSANSKFESSPDHVLAAVKGRFILNVLQDGDTTFIKHKHLDIDTHIDFLKGKDIMTIQPTTVHLEGSEFSMSGTIDFLKDALLDLTFTGNKPNFDLFVAMAPEEIIPRLMEYENKGEVYIKTQIKGRAMNGHTPAINAQFGCHNGYVINPKTGKKIDELNFEGAFTNGKEHNLASMKFALHDFRARPAAGELSGDIEVNDFTAPHVAMKISSNFNLGFVSKFLNLDHLHDVSGNARINVQFEDIIDLDAPQNSIAKLNENYEMIVALDNVHFRSDAYPLPLKNLNFLAEIHGHEAKIKLFDLRVGKSDMEITGTIDDLPAIIHHTNIPVDTRLKISSKYLDLFELTGSDENAIDEQIENLSLDASFKASAKSFTESKYLPEGEFFIENLYAKLKHYPHTLHDFHADIFVEERDLRIVDFKGMIDKSDFLFTGKLEHYERWFDAHPNGDSKIEFDLTSSMLQLESFLSYKGTNYVPEEYQHEELDNLRIHGFTYLHYDEKLKSIDLNIDRFNATMKVHPLRFENFNGKIHYEQEHLVIEDFHGTLGKSKFNTTLHYYLGDDEAMKKRENHFSITASHLDLDELIKYNPAPVIKKHKNGTVEKKAPDHDAVFNIYELPFTHMTYHLDIKHLNYHRYLMHNIKGALRTTPKHYIYVDHLNMDAAGGHFDIDGYFNGSNPDLIYFNPIIKASNIDLDKLLFKFDNFGQDHIVSENLHGKFTGTITGKVHMHADFVPKIDDSEIHMDVDVENGRLENYALLTCLSDYFKDKNLKKILFDDLSNKIDLVDGVMTVPAMVINSSMGHMEISGKQELNGTMEYYLKIPWKMVTNTVASKLFGRKKDEVSSEQTDEIQYGSEKTKYVNVKITGNENGYKFSLGKKRG